jgi:hypothetical protein
LRTWHGSCWCSGDRDIRSGDKEMAKFEALAFTIGFIATGLLTIVAQVQIV